MSIIGDYSSYQTRRSIESLQHAVKRLEEDIRDLRAEIREIYSIIPAEDELRGDPPERGER